MTEQVFLPFQPDVSPYQLPYQAFDDIINTHGLRLAWCKSHACPCVYGGPIPGSPDPRCQTCHGRAVYWDAAVGPFTALMTFVHFSPTPDEPGTLTDDKVGQFTTAEPALTIPYAAGTVYTEASTYDLFIEIDAISRYNAVLQVSGQTNLPYPQGLTVAASGAVTVYDSVNHIVVPTNSYTVSGSTVTLSGYPENTAYNVEFTAAPTYVGYRSAGSIPHVRPFAQITQPRKFRLQQLDLWLRQLQANDVPVFG